MTSTSTTTAAARGTRYVGLDGLRAIAVSLVVAYHLFPSWWFPQGFLGVDVFFVISGFLITSLLLRETAATGRIAYAEFWRRRARRLLPALAALIGVCGMWAWFIGGDVLVGLGRQVLGALTFSSNWLALSTGQGYFASANPELFRNLWSLAVEEQFYVLWPIVLPLVLLIPGRVARSLVAATAGLLSAGWMTLLVIGSADPTRAYFGTDAHGFGILLGVALAFALTGRARRPVTVARRRATDVVGAAAVIGVLAIAAFPQSSSVATFPGALLAASVLTVVAIAAATADGSRLGAVLDAPPLRWVGQRSYGIYLWHWPLLVLLMAGLVGAGAETGVPTIVGLTALALTLVISAASYRFLEQPVRRIGFRGSLRRVGRRLVGTPASRFAALSVLTAGALAACATTGAIAAAPEETSSEQVVSDGAAALAESQASPAPPLRTPTPSDTATPRPSASEQPSSPQPSPSPSTVTGDQISAVGDSVMLASAPGLLERLPGIQIDAEVSRSMWAGIGILEKLAAQGALRPYVVVGLGTNGPVSEQELNRIADAAGADRHVILVTAHAARDWIPGVNEELAAFARKRSNVTLADWNTAISPHEDVLAGDRIHPGAQGGRIYADTVADAVQSIEDRRAQRIFHQEQLEESIDKETIGRDTTPR